MSETMTRFDDLENSVHQAYRQLTPKSQDWYRRACKSLVAGVSGTVRYYPPYPIYAQSGMGSKLSDIDGNVYIDCFLSGACHLLGHRQADVLAEIEKSKERGTLVINPTYMVELAEKLQRMIPCAERVRFLNSGTEAIMSALRFARAYTGRSKIIKFNGIYHGMDDQILTGLDSRARVLGGGIPEASIAETVLLDFGDLEAIESRLQQEDIAAVLIDPTMHHGGLWAQEPGFYQQLSKLTQQTGCLLIFDEVISGFRLAPGGAQQFFEVTPDLAVFGKAFAVGESLGAVVGRADVMAVCDPSPDRLPGPFAFQSGTCNDASAAQAASFAALTQYEKLGEAGEYGRLAGLAKQLGDGIQQAFSKRGLPCQFKTLGPMMRLFLDDGPFNYAHLSKISKKPINLFHLALITEDVFTLPGSNDFFLSFAHTEQDVEDIVSAANRVLEKYEFSSVLAI